MKYSDNGLVMSWLTLRSLGLMTLFSSDSSHLRQQVPSLRIQQTIGWQ